MTIAYTFTFCAQCRAHVQQPHDHPAPEKAPMDLLDRDALEAAAHVMGFGARKYKVDDWRDGQQSVPKFLAKVLRHVYADLSGEHIDPESGRPHLAHALCDIMFSLHFRLHPEKQQNDTRFQK